ncbi:DNA polymerase iota, variant 2 [Coccidioides immitis RS]|uniref:DNA polymerase iota, variant 2 n=3 Tax=Coccidioides immitis TaxID=5501 RepID=A0A0D8JV64_COCIM|nr:DNA polymerase iota, variant 2 [Coccidioides immitis RS]KJF60153.1 DNA polymerase iota, variant 2 [Coccidioides immitis RS]KMP01469.1 hypothetical protein CIRG_01609 [Coccidioides immitis RMSCC 2394]
MTSLLRKQAALRRDDSRIIIHFDYDCFYASVFETENPALKSLPVAVQQKQIVVTCNYEARRRGLRKLQLIKDAKRTCPDVVIVLGEDLTKFRDASKELHSFLKKYIWGDRVEKLGFDEVFLDVTSMIDHNAQFLNRNDLRNSFFQLDKNDPTVGFSFDAGAFCGPTWPPNACSTRGEETDPEMFSSLGMRLILGSHLANYLRFQLEEHTGYTATVGISTSKLLAKLVGNANKPKNQTTLIPPYSAGTDGQQGNIDRFLCQHEVGEIPGIGFKMANRIRAHILGRQPSTELYQSLTDTDRVTVGAVRSFPNMGPLKLDKILRGGGWPNFVGTKVWCLLNGIDPTDVAAGKVIPSQISIEDSYRQVDSIQAVRKELRTLACNLLRRMHADLTQDAEDEEDIMTGTADEDGREALAKGKKRWLAFPKTLRISTRSRLPPLPDGTHPFNSRRISRSCPIPQFVFSFHESIEALAERLIEETLIPLFRRLHPDKSAYKLSLINIAATNMIECAGSEKSSMGQDIGKMFQNRTRVPAHSLSLNPTSKDAEYIDDRLDTIDMGDSTDSVNPRNDIHDGKEQHSSKTSTTKEIMDNWDEEEVHGWASDDEISADKDSAAPCHECQLCGSLIPSFAAQAHATYHSVRSTEVGCGQQP